MLKHLFARLSLALTLVAAPACAQTATPISKLPIASAVNTQTDYAVGIVRQIVNGVPAFGTYRVPLSILVGPAGPANTLGIGTVATLPAGSQATALFSGQSPNQLLSLALPAGATGPQGLTGPMGAAGTAASFASVSATTLTPGSQATATLGGTGPSAYTLTFGLPQGTPGTGNGNVNTTGTPAAGQLAFYPGTSSNTISPLTTALGVGLGGTGGTTAATARSGIGAAASGSNGDITALTGLTTALPLTEGGTGATTASAARSGLGAAASGANSDITSLSGLTTALSIGQGGTGATTASTALSNLGGLSSTTATATYAPLASPALTGTPTAPTAATGTNTTQIATMAAVQTAIAGAGGGSASPSTTIATTSGTNVACAAADKGKTYVFAGSATYTLGTPCQVSGWYAWVQKIDGNGVWAVTPTGKTIDTLSSISMYTEGSYLIWWDNTNSAFRTIGRPRGWINLGSTTITGSPTALNFTVGFNDPELRDMQFDGENITFGAADQIIVRIQKSGSYQTTGYTGVLSSVTGSATGQTTLTANAFLVGFGSASSIVGFTSDVYGFSAVSGSQRISSSGYDPTGPQIRTAQTYQTTSAAITGFQVQTNNGNAFAGGVVNQKGFRP